MTRNVRSRWHYVVAAATVMSSACAFTTNIVRDDRPIAVGAKRPAASEPRVELKNDHIEVRERIHFAFGSDKIESDSFGLLNEIAKVLKDNEHVKKVRIEGHTDNVGDADFNLKLSRARAKSVRKYLVEQGVLAKRLVSEGYGLSRPVATNDTDEGRTKNRRVEFNIVDQDSASPAATASAGGDS